MASVSMRNIRKTYDNNVEVIRGVNLEVKEGEFMVFVGPSGCGKTTMMRMIAGLEEITDGELYVGEQLANDLPPVERKIAMVFQSYALYPHMTVAENMGFGLKLAKTPKAEVLEAVGKAAEILHISHLLDRRPKALSGGQRQRVAIGRAIVRKPGVFLFDEPLSNLDAGLRVQMRLELTKLHRELGNTMIYVTHDQTEAMTMGDRIAVFNQGRVEQVGSPMTLYRDPANTFVAEFLGSPKMNLMPATRVPGTAALRVGEAMLPLPTDRSIPDDLPDEIVLGVRPEQFDVQSASGQPGAIEARIDVVEHLGDTVLLHANVPGLDTSIAIKLPEEGGDWQPGMAMSLIPREGAMLLFSHEGQRIA